MTTPATLPKVTPFQTRTVDGYLVEVFDCADLWLLPEPAPAYWHEIVYRISKDGRKVKGSARAAKIGAYLVEQLKKYRTAEGQNAFISIREWLNS